MRIVEINTSADGSTGRIMLQIAEKARECGHIVYTFSARRFYIPYEKLMPAPEGHEYFGSYAENFFHFLFTRFLGLHGYFSWLGTFKLIKKIKRIKPDIVNLHNLHGSCICIPLLFSYLRKNKIRVIWTLQDCWAITGCCTHFVRANCMKWQEGCGKCPLYKEGYLKSNIDQSRLLWKMKSKSVSGFKHFIIVPSSQWLEKLVKKSYLGQYKTSVIYNGIDLNVFKPTTSDVRSRYGIENKFVLLGVSSFWDDRKGLDVFIRLAGILDKERFSIVLVGTSNAVDEKLPPNIVSIHRTANQNDLAAIYTIADLFINPTREDDFPTVNLEALACGTPVVAFNTGGCAEAVDESSGYIVDCNDLQGLIDIIYRSHEDYFFSRKHCRERAKLFDKNERYLEYIQLYEQFLSNND